jgi:hypothetical protein
MLPVIAGNCRFCRSMGNWIQRSSSASNQQSPLAALTANDRYCPVLTTQSAIANLKWAIPTRRFPMPAL